MILPAIPQPLPYNKQERKFSLVKGSHSFFSGRSSGLTLTPGAEATLYIKSWQEIKLLVSAPESTGEWSPFALVLLVFWLPVPFLTHQRRHPGAS
jgi:hypothetical protein